MKPMTPKQQGLLRTLHDVATHEGGWIIVKNSYHSPAAALIRRGLAEQQDRFPYRPGYKITPAGVAEAERQTVA